MAVIPWNIYKNVEWHLHNRAHLVENAVENMTDIEDDVFNGSRALSADTRSPSGTSKHSDPTAQKAMTIIRAHERVENARKWGFVMDKTFAYFEGTLTGEVALRFYGQRRKILQIATDLDIDRQTIRRHRDEFVCLCALYASESGLIHIERREAVNE